MPTSLQATVAVLLALILRLTRNITNECMVTDGEELVIDSTTTDTSATGTPAQAAPPAA